MDERVCRAVEKVRNEIKASATPDLPLFITEWNVQGMMDARDTIFVGPALANTVRQCDGLADMMSFWTFSDVFEEGGPDPEAVHVGMFGLRAKGGINKPSYYAFGLLHELGSERLTNAATDVIATKSANGGDRGGRVEPRRSGSTAVGKDDRSGLPARAAQCARQHPAQWMTIMEMFWRSMPRWERRWIRRPIRWTS